MPIELKAVYTGLRTMIDGGIRITLDISEDEVEKAMELMKLKDKLIHVVVMTEEQVMAHGAKQD